MDAKRIAALLACLALAGCGKEADTKGPSAPHGRYLGVGTYPAGRLWAQRAGVPEPADKAKARLADDEHVIVVVDSNTGEIRACGDMSGYCLAMNPWRGAAQPTPATLAKHSFDLDAEDAVDALPANASAAATAPARKNTR